MREIKFKGKRKDNCEWVKGFYFKTEAGEFIGLYNEEVEVIHETVGQFTGLYDINGKEIYEGDTVKLSDYKQPFKVKFHDGSFILYDTLSDCNAFTLAEFKIKYLKVVVIDNTELIK